MNDIVKKLWHCSAHLRTINESDLRDVIDDAADEIELMQDQIANCEKIVASQSAEIERLIEVSRSWQATAAGLSQDASNAEDETERMWSEIERLSESLSNALRLLASYKKTNDE
jgi:archaellum component FlaC